MKGLVLRKHKLSNIFKYANLKYIYIFNTGWPPFDFLEMRQRVPLHLEIGSATSCPQGPLPWPRELW